jgi:RNA polymerase sigma factor (TIGR02999 family)
LISELFLRLFGAQRPPELNDRQHFYRVAARQMRRILLDHARSRTAAKRDGQLTRVPGEDLPADPTGFGNPGHLDLDRALDGLAALDPRAAAVVELRYYAGLSEREVAALQNVSPSTVRRDWDFARAWLLARLSGSVS